MAEKKIEGTIYRFDELTGREALASLAALKKAVAPYAALIEASGVVDDAARGTVLARLLPDMLGADDENFIELLDMLLKNTTADGDPAVLGVKPQTLDEIFQVAAFVLEAQFVGFFGGKGAAAMTGLLRKVA